MKKQAVISKTGNLQKKRTHYAGAAQNKNKKQAKTAKTQDKNVKRKSFDVFHAIFLTGVLVIISVCVSLAVILIRSGMNRVSVSEYVLPGETIDAQTTGEPAFVEPEPANYITDQPLHTAPSPASVVSTAVPQRVTEQLIENSGTLVFVIDDAGNNLRELEPFLKIPVPLTIAVLPGLPYSAEAARRIRAAGKEVFLHQPMEAIGAQNPGPGAIYSGMSAEEIRSILERNVAEVGPIAGINNHQGSKITMDSGAVETILAFCAENNLHFLDSRTTAESIVPAVAQKMGIRIAERNVFIDNENDRDSMLHYISTALARSKEYGSAVMIGHVWSGELAPLLAEQIPLYVKKGYNIKTASDIIVKR
ncbi:MAG: divergent polysaccharide deacetylase family protein [Treponema sp.]|nr:divergent polysaccharide deacetylase family protein [Treponema sp.]